MSKRANLYIQRLVLQVIKCCTLHVIQMPNTCQHSAPHGGLGCLARDQMLHLARDTDAQHVSTHPVEVWDVLHVIKCCTLHVIQIPNTCQHTRWRSGISERIINLLLSIVVAQMPHSQR